MKLQEVVTEAIGIIRPLMRGKNVELRAAITSRPTPGRCRPGQSRTGTAESFE